MSYKQFILNYVMQNINAFGHSVDNQHVIIWGCFAKVKAHKKHWSTLNANPLELPTVS